MNIVNKIFYVWIMTWISLFLIGRELMNIREVVLYVWVGALISFFLICLYLRVIGITRVIEPPNELEEVEV